MKTLNGATVTTGEREIVPEEARVVSIASAALPDAIKGSARTI